MSSKDDRGEIESIFQQLLEAHAEHDADAIVRAYAPDAVIYDLAPPLQYRGMSRDSVVDWLLTWDGPIRLDALERTLTLHGELAFASALMRMRGRIKEGQEQDLWYRSTLCFRKSNGRWLIVHDHASVPFYMDGNFRAAVDLKP